MYTMSRAQIRACTKTCLMIGRKGKIMMKKTGKTKEPEWWLLALFCLCPFFYGIYYEFCGTIAFVIIAGLLLWSVRRERKLAISFDVGTTMAALLTISYLFMVIWAVDRGMSFLGFFKVAWVFLFLLGVQWLCPDSREKALTMVPYIGVAQCLISFVGYFIPYLQEHLYVNHRLGGFFQYPNTFAVFLLAGVIVLCEKEKTTIWDYVFTAVLMIGIGMTGSRTVFVLTVMVYLFVLFRRKNAGLLVEGILFAVAFGILLYVSKDAASIGRITTFSLKESTFVGRILYVADALPVLLKHPFGMGYLGYYYIQNEIQTGVYTVRYIHNDWMQIGLDVGWIPMLAYSVAVVKTWLSHNVSVRNKLILAVFVLHGLFDFDAQYTCIGVIIYLIMSEVTWKQLPERYQTVRVNRSTCMIATGMMGLAAVYLTVPLMAAYFEQPEVAVKWYPWYTEEQLKLLSESEDVDEVDALADQILAQNDTCALAYQAKAIVAYCSDDYEGVMKWQKEAIARDPFQYDAYVEYASMLYDGAELLQDTDPEQAQECVEEIRNIPDYLKEAGNKVSRLGKMIDEQPQLSVDDTLSDLLNAVE